jgi:signal transduction histidine kinase/ActR/RegA family two-component response regulator
MIPHNAAARDDRVLLLAPTRKDASTTAALLRDAGIPLTGCTTFDDLLAELSDGAGVVIVPEEAMTPERNARLAGVLKEQPPWSDLPILVLAYAGATSAATGDAVRTLGNVTVLERPLRVQTLLSAVRTALRARQRQYQIREHLAERARAEESLRRADQRKDEFLATLGHELRNPLAPLLSGMHLLRLGGFDQASAARVMAVMERQITHLVRLVDDLLEVSRITRGLIEVRHDPLDLVPVVRAALDTCRPVIEAAGHEVTINVPEAPIAVSGDPVRLTQVFANLLTNAAKYTNAGGRIEVTVSQAAGRAMVSVRDNGIGIPPAHLRSVFDMFMQVDRSNRRAQGGLGIGLTLVRTLIEMHGGRVEARSAGVGKGSEFLIELPMLGENVFEGEPPTALRRFPDRRILVVDDNRDAAETLGALLEALGATVSVVHSGRSALECLDRFGPDTMLLDIGMPEMDGYEVARRVRATPNHAHTLLIALTGWGQDQDYRRSRAAGFDHHLVKPPDIDKLREILTKTPLSR